MFRSLFALLQASRASNTTLLPSAADASTHASSGDEAQRVIDESLREMERVITRLDATKASAQAECNESAAMLRTYKAAWEDLRTRAKHRVQAGQSEAARDLLAEQHSLETVIASFERIAGNMAQTVQKLTAQLDSMRIQREELKAQRTVLAAQLVSAQSQEEFLEKLRASGASHEFLEREAIQAELRAPAGSAPDEFAGLSADSALTALENQIQSELALERAEKERLRNEVSLRRFQVAFATAEKIQVTTKTPLREIKTQIPESIPPDTSAVLSNIAQSAEAQNKQRMMDNFFTTTEPQNPQPSTPNNGAKDASKDEAGATNNDSIANFFLQNP